MGSIHNKGGNRSSGGTVGIGITSTAGAGKAVSGTLMIVFDTKGNVGFLESGGGGTYAGVSWSGGVIIQFTNAKDIFQLRKLSTQIGGSVGVGPSIGAEYVIGKGYRGVNIIFGKGGGLTPAEVHAIAEYAKVQGRSKEEIIKFVKDLILKKQVECK